MSRSQGPEAGCSVVPVSAIPTGHHKCEGPGHMQNLISCENSPDRYPTGHVHGMDGHCYRKCSFKQVGISLRGEVRPSGEMPAQEGTRGANTDTEHICTQELPPPNPESTPRHKGSRGVKIPYRLRGVLSSGSEGQDVPQGSKLLVTPFLLQDHHD